MTQANTHFWLSRCHVANRPTHPKMGMQHDFYRPKRPSSSNRSKTDSNLEALTLHLNLIVWNLRWD